MSKYLLIITLCLLTVGCSITSSKNPQFYQEQNKILATKNNFKISGKIAIINNTQKISTYLNIEVLDNTYLIYLTDITGSTIFKLTKDKNKAELIDKDGNIHTGDNANKLVKELTNIDLPCDDLPFILKGNPLDFKHTNAADGSLESVDYNDMHIEYQNYMEQNNLILPRNINITGSEFTLRIKINSWEI
jgi:outer membrane lipoprotein LolB